MLEEVGLEQVLAKLSEHLRKQSAPRQVDFLKVGHDAHQSCEGAWILEDAHG